MTLKKITPLTQSFLDASSHLYKRVCPSIRRSVHWSVSHAFVKIAENGIMQDEIHLMSCIQPCFSGVHLKSQSTQASSVAQWKRAGPITQRSMDRNHPLLSLFLSSDHSSPIFTSILPLLPPSLDSSVGRAEDCSRQCGDP